MARRGRYFLPDQPLHVIQRGNNRKAISFGCALCAIEGRHKDVRPAKRRRDVHCYSGWRPMISLIGKGLMAKTLALLGVTLKKVVTDARTASDFALILRRPCHSF
jgi:hypothetical protein